MQIHINPSINKKNIDMFIAIILDTIEDYEIINDVKSFTETLIKEIKMLFTIADLIDNHKTEQILNNIYTNIKNLFLTYHDKIKEFVEFEKFDKISIIDFTDYGKINILIIKSYEFIESLHSLTNKNESEEYNNLNQKLEKNDKKLNEIDKLISEFEKLFNRKNT